MLIQHCLVQSSSFSEFLRVFRESLCRFRQLNNWCSGRHSGNRMRNSIVLAILALLSIGVGARVGGWHPVDLATIEGDGTRVLSYPLTYRLLPEADQVEDVADFCVEAISGRSNSAIPQELVEITSA